MLTATLPTVAELEAIIAERRRRSSSVSPAGSSHGGGEQEDLDEGHHLQGRKVSEDGLRGARQAERGLETGLRGNKAQPPTLPSHS